MLAVIFLGLGILLFLLQVVHLVLYTFKRHALQIFAGSTTTSVSLGSLGLDHANCLSSKMISSREIASVELGEKKWHPNPSASLGQTRSVPYGGHQPGKSKK